MVAVDGDLIEDENYEMFWNTKICGCCGLCAQDQYQYYKNYETTSSRPKSIKKKKNKRGKNQQVEKSHNETHQGKKIQGNNKPNVRKSKWERNIKQEERRQFLKGTLKQPGACPDEAMNVGAEVGLAGMTFPNNQKLLQHPNFWIADTAASIYMTPHKDGMVQMKKKEQMIQMGNKTVEKTVAVGRINGVVYDRYGDERSRAALTDVAYTASSNL